MACQTKPFLGRQNLKEKVFIPSIEWRLSPRHMQDMDLELRGKF